MNAVTNPLNQEISRGVVFLKSIPGRDLSSTSASDSAFPNEIAERERRLLFSFSNDITGVCNKNQLFQTIEWKIKNLLGFSHFFIGTINDDRKTFSSFLSDQEVKRRDTMVDKTGVEQKHMINDGVLNEVLCTPELKIYNLEHLARHMELPVYLKANFEAGIKQTAIMRLSNDNEAFGFWMVFFGNKTGFDETKSILTKGFANHISCAVFNIIKDQKAGPPIIEISKYNQVPDQKKTDVKPEPKISYNFPEIIGKSAKLQETFRLISLVAPSNSTVLICGETGTGKELVARAIHNSSPRKDKPIVKVNCAALPSSLIESELFGHERGSFTGAFERRIGKFELANDGTIFLDEIGELPLELQVKLLRVLQEKEIERVGGKNTISVNVRIIAATNRDLEKDVQDGKFRSDLYYRLNVFPIQLAPLRNRREDIPILASHFIDLYSRKTGKQVNALGTRALQELTQYNWPGNIRELEHFIERSILLTCGNTIEQICLPSAKQNMPTQSGETPIAIKTIRENECDHILNILKYCNGRINGHKAAAEILGVPPSTLNSKIKKLGIRREYLNLSGG